MLQVETSQEMYQAFKNEHTLCYHLFLFESDFFFVSWNFSFASDFCHIFSQDSLGTFT